MCKRRGDEAEICCDHQRRSFWIAPTSAERGGTEMYDPDSNQGLTYPETAIRT